MKTCVLRFGVFGIWFEGADGTNFNAMAQFHHGKFWLQAMTSAKPTCSATSAVSLELSVTSMVDTAAA